VSPPTIDFESYSEAGYLFNAATARWQGITPTSPGLPAVGATVYSEHPSTQVLCLAYDLLQGTGPQLWLPGMPPPSDLHRHIAAGGLLEAHNAGFEYWIWLNVCHKRMGWPPLPYWQLRCSMAKCRAYSLPGKLGEVAKVLGAAQQKDTRGEQLIRRLSVPQQATKTRAAGQCTDPALHAELWAYCIQDVRAEQSVSSMVPDLSDGEQQLWLLDQDINIRGVAIDRNALADCINTINQATDKYTAELRQLTGGTVQSVGEIAKTIGWLGAQGVHTSTLDADRVEELLSNEDWEYAPQVKRVLEIRASLGAAAVKKLFAIDRMLAADGRLHDLFSFCGADRTGRWAGRGPQPQNLPGGGPKVRQCSGCDRPHWFMLDTCPACGLWQAPEESAAGWSVGAVNVALADIATGSLEHVEARWGDAVAAVSGCLRGLFSAGPGCELICSDYSAIEAVVLAELAGEAWRQEVFRTHGKIYEASASKITGIPLADYLRYKEDNRKHHRDRKLGKVAELASGYGGGLGAWKAFGADEFLTDDEIQEKVRAWRLASPAVTQLWWNLQDAAIAAIQYPGQCYSYRSIAYGMRGDILFCRLPSGRTLTYHTPRLGSKMMPWGKETTCIRYMGWNSNYLNGPVGWMQLETYGPKLTENVVQAVARDLLAHGMQQLAGAGYPIVLHVHDEIVAEVPHGWGSVEEFERLMSTMPAWAAGWPVKAADGWRGQRYRKG
jgi:DNA polymerase bacteriophage-type